jgi:hypothetical protein
MSESTLHLQLLARGHINDLSRVASLKAKKKSLRRELFFINLTSVIDGVVTSV